MRRRTLAIYAAATATVVALALWGWHARSVAHEHLVRVGGAQNPCACTRRIEP